MEKDYGNYHMNLNHRVRRFARGGECFIPNNGFVIAAGLMPFALGTEKNEERLKLMRGNFCGFTSQFDEKEFAEYIKGLLGGKRPKKQFYKDESYDDLTSRIELRNIGYNDQNMFGFIVDAVDKRHSSYEFDWAGGLDSLGLFHMAPKLFTALEARAAFEHVKTTFGGVVYESRLADLNKDRLAVLVSLSNGCIKLEDAAIAGQMAYEGVYQIAPECQALNAGMEAVVFGPEELKDSLYWKPKDYSHSFAVVVGKNLQRDLEKAPQMTRTQGKLLQLGGESRAMASGEAKVRGLEAPRTNLLEAPKEESH